ncbi:MAG: hypothetical protein ABJ327_26260 [Litoreibacter sp.]
MNALPVNKNQSPNSIIDELIADHGARRVFFALIARVFTRSRPPDTHIAKLGNQPGVEYLSDRERADIGLPPKEQRDLPLDLYSLRRNDFL